MTTITVSEDTDQTVSLASGDNLIVAAGVALETDDLYGVDLDNDTGGPVLTPMAITVEGSIVGRWNGVYAASTSAGQSVDIMVTQTGFVRGQERFGLLLSDNADYIIDNDGTIQGRRAAIVTTNFPPSGSLMLDNDGEIIGNHRNGIAAVALQVITSQIVNTGTIVNNNFGAAVSFRNGANGTIDNSGILSSEGRFAVEVKEDGGALELINSGTLIGGIQGSVEVDTVLNSGSVEGGSVSLAGGDDVFANSRGGSVSGAVYGGDGDDELSGARGADDFRGGEGDDTLRGGRGDDTLNGDNGDDSIVGQRGDDSLIGGQGKDTLKGGGGGDTLEGRAGNDFLKGGTSNDIADGGRGNDRVAGNLGDDELSGGGGRDTLNGGGGSDRLTGGQGDDLLKGGQDGDVFVFAQDHGTDRVLDFDSDAAGEVIDLSGITGLQSLRDVLAAAAQRGEDVHITTGQSSVIVLEDVALTELGADDFLFSSG